MAGYLLARSAALGKDPSKFGLSIINSAKQIEEVSNSGIENKWYVETDLNEKSNKAKIKRKNYVKNNKSKNAKLT